MSDIQSAPEACSLCGCLDFRIGFDEDSAKLFWICAGCGTVHRPPLDNSVDKVKPQDE